MDKINKQNLQSQNNSESDELPSPDFSQISEKNKKSYIKELLFIVSKVVIVLLIFIIIISGVLGAVYYKNFKQAADLSFAAKNNLELALHEIINRNFDEGAKLINQANLEFNQAKILLDQVMIVRYYPYIGRQVKTVDKLLIAGIKLTESGERVVLLIDEIIEPLQNESITYATITPEQKRDILNKIVESEDLLLEVQKQVDEAVKAIDSIPDKGLVKFLREGVIPLKENLPKVKQLIDRSLPMIRVIPKVVGFDQPKSYLFLLQNNSELRPTGGFIGTYGILNLQDGEIREFQTDNIYNLDRATQHVLKEPAPWQIAKYLEQKNWSLRDINWSPDFPTTAEKALYMYQEENRILQEIRASGGQITGEGDIVLTDTIPFQDVDGVIAVTPEIIQEILKLTGPIAVEGIMFTDENLTEQLEFYVGREYKALGLSLSERKEIIKKLADQIKLKLLSLPFHRVTDILEIAYKSLDQKQILIYVKDPELQELVRERGWAGEIKNTDNDYLMVVDSNMASLKTDQFVNRFINYSLNWQGDDLIAKTTITYKNEGDFTWKSTRLRTYSRVYVPLGSQLISSSGAMENDKLKDPEGNPGEIEVAEEFNKTYFGAFISIEPHEIGVLSFEYKLPERIKEQIRRNNYNLLVQKQPGVIHNLTLDLNFDKTIKSANPAELESEFFNTSYDLETQLNQDKEFTINLK